MYFLSDKNSIKISLEEQDKNDEESDCDDRFIEKPNNPTGTVVK